MSHLTYHPPEFYRNRSKTTLEIPNPNSNQAKALLENYQSSTDPYLKRYFSDPRRQKHLKKIGLVNKKTGQRRSNAELDAYHARKKCGMKTDNLIKRVVHQKAEEIKRKEKFEQDKVIWFEEKKNIVERVKSARRPLSARYTKNLDVSYQFDDTKETFEDEDQDQLADPETRIPLPRSVDKLPKNRCYRA